MGNRFPDNMVFQVQTECGLDNIYLFNGFTFARTSRGQAVSISKQLSPKGESFIVL